ncbi:CinA family protein [Solicola gregarius]|uniref:CinA family protein n=1 Tax=Solicola gregarius TaxID=2908642 RepID=A0AA46TGT4_9ACTN|nr:CinA family protein [Solicola gregarius]UYM04532.1 CinA family protein [Solicola gregarius]
MSDPQRVVDALRGAGLTIATAESLTGGLLCATLVDVPGASEVVRGGVVAYAADLKTSLLGVEATHLESHGTVDRGTAERMARGTRERCGSDLGIATTGVAGPDPSEGKPAGTVFIAIADESGVAARALALGGDRAQIRRGTVDAALDLVLERLGERCGTGK